MARILRCTKLIKEMENLHSITDIRRLDRVHKFYNKLWELHELCQQWTSCFHLRAPCTHWLTSLDWGVIAQTDDKLEEWTLEQLVEALRKFVDRNSLRTETRANSKADLEMAGKMQKNWWCRVHKDTPMDRCVYCGSTNHSSVNCTKVLTVSARKRAHTKEEFVLQLYWW